MEYGLIGRTLKHSFSVEVHRSFGYGYELKELEPEELEEFFRKREFKGINVTIPYKTEVMKYLDEIDASAEEIGAVNTVVNTNGKLKGFNTDIFGMKKMFEKAGVTLKNKRVLILGTGGTSKTAFFVAVKSGAKEVVKVSRNPKVNEISYDEAEATGDRWDIIINTTPCGMYPNANSAPIDIGNFPNLKAVFDAIYNPLRTELILKAEERGIKALGGLYMLVSQGVYSASLFQDTELKNETIDEIYIKLFNEKRNIVLIGMPGCGKSTIAEMLGEFVDTDLVIEEQTGRKCGEIIKEYGEQFFRDTESKVIEELSVENGLIISTGGGAVLREENVKNLKKNGVVIYLEAPLERLGETASRPLSDTREKLEKMYAERKPVYEKACDVKVSAGGTAEDTLKQVKEAVK